MATLAELIVRIGADISGFEGEIKGVNQKARQLGNDLTTIGAGLTAGLTVPLVGIGAAALKSAGEFEQTVIAFNTMLGSGERASALLHELEEFAKGTPFEFTDLTEASKRLLAMGFEAEQIIPTLTAVGDAVAGVGGGAVGVDRVTLALGQMQAKGKVSAQEMNQLTEAAIPAWELLAETLNTDVAGAMALVQKRAVDSGPAIEGMIQGINERFGGMMAEQSKTILGQFSNLKDQLGFILRDFGAGLAPAAQDTLDAIKPLTAELREMAKAFAGAEPETQKWITGVGLAAAGTGPFLLALGQLVNLSASSWQGIRTLSQAIGGLTGAVKLGVIAALAVEVVNFAIAMRGLGDANEQARDSVDTLAKQNMDLARQLREVAKETDKVNFSSRDTWPKAQEGVDAYNKRLREMFAANKDVIGSLAQQKQAVDATTGSTIKHTAAMLDSAKATQTMAERAVVAEEAIQSLGAMFRVVNDNEIHRLGEELKANTNPALKDLGIEAVTLHPQIEDLSGVLGEVPSPLGEIAKESTGAKEALTQVSTAVTDLGKKLADSIIHMRGLKDAAVDFGEAILRIVLEQALKPLINQLSDVLVPALDKVLGKLGEIFGFASGSGVFNAGTFGPSPSGGAPGSGGGGGGGGGVGGALSMWTAFAQLGSSILGNFQNARQEDTLNAIEYNTRVSAIVDQKEPSIQSENLVYITGNTDEIKTTLWAIRDKGITLTEAVTKAQQDSVKQGAKEGIKEGLGELQLTRSNAGTPTLAEDLARELIGLPARSRAGQRPAGQPELFVTPSNTGESTLAGDQSLTRVLGAFASTGRLRKQEQAEERVASELEIQWAELRKFADETQRGALVRGVGNNIGQIAGEAFLALVSINTEILAGVTTMITGANDRLSTLSDIVSELKALNTTMSDFELTTRINMDELVLVVSSHQARQSALA